MLKYFETYLNLKTTMLNKIDWAKKKIFPGNLNWDLGQAIQQYQLKI